MTDKRWKALGETLVNYSLGVKPGERLMIAMYELESYPLALAAYTACVKAGGFAQIQFMSEALKHALLKHGSPEQIAWVPEIEAYGMEWADHYLALRGAFNLYECYDIATDKIASYQKAMGIISTLRWQKTNWALVRVPNERFAQQAQVSYEKIMDMFFDACNLDWPEHVAHWQKVADKLNQGRRIRVVGRDTDFSFAYENEVWKVSENRINIPDGEFFITPKWETVQGHIYFEFPAMLGGRVINDLKLTFTDGLVTEVSASSNQDFVEEILTRNEPGARRCGEFAFGTNPHIDVATTDILWDEKILGTIHIALGRPYNGAYDSPIHWDIVKDTRTDAKIYLDDELIFQDGKFLI